MNTDVSPAALAPSTPRVYRHLYVENFTERVVLAYIAAVTARGSNGKTAPLFEDVCQNSSCKAPFVVRAFTYLAQMKKYRPHQGEAWSFRPPIYCKECFDVARGVSIPVPPGNAVLTKAKEKWNTIPATLNAKLLSTYRRTWESTEVAIRFKPVVSFSDKDESGSPDTGRVISIGATTITINDDGAPPHTARTFALADIASIEHLDIYVESTAIAAVNDALQNLAAPSNTTPDKATT